MESIQEIVFENKEKIPEGLYLELMNAMKKEHDNNKNDYYEIEYMVLESVIHNKNHVNIVSENTIFKKIEKKESLHPCYIHKYEMTPFKPFITHFDEIPNHNIQIRYSNLISKNPDSDCDSDCDDDEYCCCDDDNMRKIHTSYTYILHTQVIILSVKKL